MNKHLQTNNHPLGISYFPLLPFVNEMCWLTTRVILGYGFWQVPFQHILWEYDRQGIGAASKTYSRHNIELRSHNPPKGAIELTMRKERGVTITALSLLLNYKAVEFCLGIALHYIRIGYDCIYRGRISMEKPIKIIVYFDYLSPWCYIAAFRLQCLEEEYKNNISISWRSYPLVVREIPNRLISSHSVESRHRAALEEDKISFSPWNPDQPYPTSSMPALRAAKCAQLQGGEAFRRFHIALFRAFFEESMNISEREVLVRLAKKTGLDVERFNSDFSSKSPEEEILTEYEDGRTEYEGWGIPIVVVGGRYPIAGAVPITIYRRAIDLCLAR